MNTIVCGQPNLNTPNFALGLAEWTLRAIQGGLIIIACGMALLLVFMPSAPLGIQVFISVMALACGVIAFTPQVLSGSSSFIADNRGIFFPHHSKRRLLEWNYKDQWLLVPWHNVADLQVEPVFAGEEGFRPGIALQIDVDNKLEEEFFSYLQSPFLRKREANMLLKICYTNSFHSPETVVEKILSLKANAGQP